MRQLLLIVIFSLLFFFPRAQSANDIIASLKGINQSVVDKRLVISHRAMNVFLADKTAYLSASTDLSFYTNYITANSAEGRITVSHNFQQAAKSNDAPIKQLLNIGFEATLGGNYAKSFLDNRFENGMGLSVSYKWLGNVKTSFANGNAGAQQQQAMNALRAGLLAQLEQELIAKEKAFNLALNNVDSKALPGQDTAAAKKIAHDNFLAQLKNEYEEKFALEQAKLLSSTGNFSVISTGWTSFNIYIPAFYPKYTVANSLTDAFSKKHPYPLQLQLGHTRLWENKTAGRLFLTSNAGLLFNNSKLAYGLNRMNYADYKSLGGTDTQYATDPGNNNLYIGNYSNFITLSLNARLVYFPSNSHVGVSVLAQKNWGNFDPLHIKAGIPIVIINKQKTPALMIECYAMFFAITNNIANMGKTAVGVSLGVPVSRLMF
ncbi:MAG: hypothetical protein QM726_01595 [Chitinophagaceae bacterium]